MADIKLGPAIVRVQLTVEVDASGSWGGDCTIDQMRRQAIEAVGQALRNGLVIDGHGAPEGVKRSRTPATIIGKPTVVVLMVKESP